MMTIFSSASAGGIPGWYPRRSRGPCEVGLWLCCIVLLVGATALTAAGTPDRITVVHATGTLSDLSSVPAQRSTELWPHRQLRQILNEPPFQQWRLREQRIARRSKNPLWDSIGNQWNRLLKWLGRYFHPRNHSVHQDHNSSANFSFATFLEILGVVVGVALVVGIVMVLFRWQAIGKAPPESTGGLLSRDKIQQAMEQGDALAMASDSWMRAAQQFGGAGDFRAMYRTMYLSLLAGLHEKGKIRFRRNHTNWHYVRDFHGDTPQRTLFGSLTDLFDHVWYGRKLYPNINPDSLRDQINSLISRGDKGA